MADADSVLEAADFVSFFPENAGIIFLSRWCLVPVALQINAMDRLFGHEYSLAPLIACQFSSSGADSCEDSSSQDSGVVVLSS